MDFGSLAKKVVEESLPKLKPIKGTVKDNEQQQQQEPVATKAAFDDFSPELQSMVGFSPNEIAAAREYLVRSAAAPVTTSYVPSVPAPVPVPEYAPVSAPIPAYVSPAVPVYAPPPPAYAPPAPGYPTKAYYAQPVVNFPDDRSVRTHFIEYSYAVR